MTTRQQLLLVGGTASDAEDVGRALGPGAPTPRHAATDTEALASLRHGEPVGCVVVVERDTALTPSAWLEALDCAAGRPFAVVATAEGEDSVRLRWAEAGFCGWTRVPGFTGLQATLASLEHAARAQAQREAGLEREKNGALARLAAHIAHDLNNLLTVVVAHASLLEDLGGKAAESARAIMEATNRGRDLTGQALALLAPVATGVPVRQHLMVVDDHPGMARVSAKLFETLGYRTSVFHDPREALEAFRKDPTGFDAVLTDLSMPHMSGEDFTQALRGIRSAVPVIVSSGRADRLSREDLTRLGVSAVLEKPWRFEEAAATLQQVLADAAPISR